jgi:hypothetical protein
VYRTHRSPTRSAAFSVRAAGLACAIALVALGCGSSHRMAPIVAGPKLPDGTPDNTTPDGTVVRLMTAYQYMAPGEYDTLLTSDFHYRFSAQSDPALVSYYGSTWGKADEGASFGHLLHGFTNTQGVYVSKATSITYQLVNDVVVNDTTHADSTAWYQAVSVSSLNIAIDVLVTGGSTTYNVSTPIVFLLVRGDAAVLSAGQAHSTSRWYIREMDDLAPALPGKGIHTMPAAPSTWGHVRAQYL